MEPPLARRFLFDRTGKAFECALFCRSIRVAEVVQVRYRARLDAQWDEGEVDVIGGQDYQGDQLIVNVVFATTRLL